MRISDRTPAQHSPSARAEQVAIRQPLQTSLWRFVDWFGLRSYDVVIQRHRLTSMTRRSAGWGWRVCTTKQVWLFLASSIPIWPPRVLSGNWVCETDIGTLATSFILAHCQAISQRLLRVWAVTGCVVPRCQRKRITFVLPSASATSSVTVNQSARHCTRRCQRESSW
jgi:hypothetical protein